MKMIEFGPILEKLERDTNSSIVANWTDYENKAYGADRDEYWYLWARGPKNGTCYCEGICGPEPIIYKGIPIWQGNCSNTSHISYKHEGCKRYRTFQKKAEVLFAFMALFGIAFVAVVTPILCYYKRCLCFEKWRWEETRVTHSAFK